MKINILFNKNNLLILFLFLFSLLFNSYYANKGAFPHDSFSHFDTGYRVLLGDNPFKDYWAITGPLIDYIQGLFFFIFGINWNAYILHASVLNSIVTIATFFLLRNFNINIFHCFLYSLLFSILAYPSSGTPFVDHHSAFLCLLGTYSLILGIKNEKNLYWILLPIFFILAFLSKQVPTTYITILIVLVLIFYTFVQKKFNWILPSFLSGFSLIIFLLIFGGIKGISLNSFLEQYISYPQSIGKNRFQDYNLTFNGVILHFKFIYISIFFLFYCYYNKIFSKKKFYKKNEFLYFLIIFLFTVSLIFHQIFTKNQTFIFFLVPLIIGFSYTQKNFSKFLSNLLILFCLFVTMKYHLRFNEERKFHELNYSNFDLSIKAENIDSKLKGLNWITPGEFSGNPSKEVNLLKQTKKYLMNDQRNFMLLTNYSFFSTILKKNSHSTTRWHTGDGTDYPRTKGKYFESYRKLIVKKIKNNNIEAIYIIHPIKNSSIYNYLNKNCFNEKKINEFLVVYNIVECFELK